MYELTYIASPNLMESELAGFSEKIRGFISESEGHVSNEKIDQKRKLAYPIKKSLFGYYITCDFEMPPEKINELQQKLKSEKNILRYLIVNKEFTEKEVSPTRAAAPKKPGKKEKVKIEELDKKLEELLKE